MKLFLFPTIHSIPGTIVVSLFLLVLCVGMVQAADPTDEQNHIEAADGQVETEPLGPTALELWEKANTYLQDDDQENAAQYFYTVFKRFPDDVNAAESLWNTALIREKFALKTKGADWDPVRNLFRLYINHYPTGNNAAQAYLELGKTYYFMRLYREAVSYFKLFLNKFPLSPLTIESKQWLGEALVKVGRAKEAEELFQVLMNDSDKNVQQIGFIGMGDLHYMKKEYRQAKDFFQMVVINYPNYYLQDPQILRKAGLANIHYGKTDRGRKQLYHYLSLDGFSLYRVEVLFGLGESYLLEKDFASAQKIYRQVIEEGQKKEKEVFFSTLRLAQIQDDPEIKLSKWEKPNDLTDSKGDIPYLNVLERYFDSPLSQDARFGLFNRYKARGDLDKAYSTGRDFLRNTDPETDKIQDFERVGTVLLYLAEALLKNKRYQDIYDLYFVEYRHVQDYPDGTILYKIGQALEALNLFDKAAIVYYRAQKWPLTDEEKIDLYYRRARVYLALNDYASADLLLKHLRTVYEGTDRVGEIYSYSGKLSEALDDNETALGFYVQAAEQPTFKEKIAEYADDALRLFLLLNQEVAAHDSLLKMREKGLEATVAQDWFLKIGNAMRLKDNYQGAVGVYSAGLQQEYPQNSNSSQAMHLYLGDCYMALNETRQGLDHYIKAKDGESAFWQKMAMERLSQSEIDNDLVEMKKVSGQ
nr:tetratricopeptide repeat protein [Desulfobulbaceae bacterium]